MAESYWFESEAGILARHAELRSEEETRHAESMIRIRKEEESFLSAFRAVKAKKESR